MGIITTTGRVLIVDDDPIVLTIFKSFFASCQISEVLTASDGKQASAILSMDASHVRLIIMDINMPEMDGIELLRHLLSIHYDGPLIICSANRGANAESAQTLAKAYGLDLTSFIQKPLTKQKLSQVFEPIVALDGHLLSA